MRKGDFPGGVANPGRRPRRETTSLLTLRYLPSERGLDLRRWLGTLKRGQKRRQPPCRDASWGGSYTPKRALYLALMASLCASTATGSSRINLI